MSGFYESMQEIASNLLETFKQGAIQYVAKTAGNGPPDNPGPGTETAFNVPGVARGVKFTYVDNAHVVTTDLQCTIPADIVTPAIEGFMRIDGTRYKIVKVIPKPAAGVAVAYTIIFRK